MAVSTAAVGIQGITAATGEVCIAVVAGSLGTVVAGAVDILRGVTGIGVVEGIGRIGWVSAIKRTGAATAAVLDITAAVGVCTAVAILGITTGAVVVLGTAAEAVQDIEAVGVVDNRVGKQVLVIAGLGIEGAVGFVVPDIEGVAAGIHRREETTAIAGLGIGAVAEVTIGREETMAATGQGTVAIQDTAAATTAGNCEVKKVVAADPGIKVATSQDIEVARSSIQVVTVTDWAAE